jgi:hypothetical protein
MFSFKHEQDAINPAPDGERNSMDMQLIHQKIRNCENLPQLRKIERDVLPLLHATGRTADAYRVAQWVDVRESFILAEDAKRKHPDKG